MTGETVSCEARDAKPVMEKFARDLMVHVGNHSPQYVFVHAGVVEVNGRALVLPGPSFAGKTTLIAALLRQGAAYYSDEYAIVDESGQVHPYSRALQMRRPGSAEQCGLEPSVFGARIGDAALTVKCIVFAQFIEGGKWTPEPLSAAMSVLEMLQHAIPVRRTPGRVLSVLTKLMCGAAAWKSERGDANETATRLLEMMRS